MPEPLISVIVPVYNVSPWLNRCIESVVNQTYKALEIILVDDGSTDDSGLMCDVWAEKDKRIRVIHKVNGGLSDARNAGIEAANGAYLAFVDSDDWLDLTMIDTMYLAIMNYDADMAVCGFFLAYDERNVRKYPCTGKIYVLNNQEAFEAAARRSYPAGDPAAWNKLYARHLWDNVRFPVGKVFEDLYVRSRLYAQCRRIAVVDKELCFYYQRENSISHTVSLKVVQDNIDAIIQDCALIAKQYPYWQAGADAAVVNSLMSMYAMKWNNREIFSPELEREIIDVFQQHKNGVWKYLHIRTKVKYLLFRISPELFYYAGKIYWGIKSAYMGQNSRRGR